MNRNRWLVRSVAVVAGLSWSCGADRLQGVDEEPLSSLERHHLSDDTSTAMHGLGDLVSFLVSPSVAMVASGLTPISLAESLPRRLVKTQSLTRSGCISAEWTSPNGFERHLSLDRCALADGTMIEGSIAVQLGAGEFEGVRNYTFSELGLGGLEVDGFVTTTPGATGNTTFVADVRFVRLGGSTRLILQHGQWVAEGPTLIDASGILSDSAGTRFSLDAHRLRTLPAACYPSAGAVELTLGPEGFGLGYYSGQSVALASTRGLAEIWPLPACP